jgi:hypothetical protein
VETSVSPRVAVGVERLWKELMVVEAPEKFVVKLAERATVRFTPRAPPAMVKRSTVKAPPLISPALMVTP